MKQRIAWLLLFASLIFCLMPTAFAKDAVADGTVLFAARYADYTSLRDTGLRFGTASWKNARMTLRDGALALSSASDHKTYLLLPDAVPEVESYILRYTFRFTEIAEMNGYCAFLLTCRGDVPSNRTELVLRADGTCDGFGKCSDALARAIADGEAVTVTVPIRHGILHEVTVDAAGLSETFRLAQVRSVSNGGRGFSARNASVAIHSVEITAGDGTAAPIGPYATQSYIAPPEWTYDEPSAPTGEGSLPICMTLLLSGVGIFAARRGVPHRIRVRRKN